MNCHRSSTSAYIDGCRCDGCREANNLRCRRLRDNQRRAAGASEWCLICGSVFHTRGGLYQHETKIHAA